MNTHRQRFILFFVQTQLHVLHCAFPTVTNSSVKAAFAPSKFGNVNLKQGNKQSTGRFSNNSPLTCLDWKTPFLKLYVKKSIPPQKKQLQTRNINKKRNQKNSQTTCDTTVFKNSKFYLHPQ